MTQDDHKTERRRLQMALYELSAAGYYLSRVPGDEAAAIRREILPLVRRCQALMQTEIGGANPSMTTDDESGYPLGPADS